MKHIVNITTTRKSIPLKTPFVTALRRVENVEFIRVMIMYDDGSYSYGEAPATKAITGEDLKSIEDGICSITTQLIDNTQQSAYRLLHNSSLGSSAKAAIDIALSQPKLLAKHATQTIQTDITISFAQTDTMVHKATQAYTQGIKFLKIKLAQDIQHAITTTHALCKALPDATFLIDANQAWDLHNALVYVESVQEHKNIALIEQPVAANALHDLRTITQTSTIPILADESVFQLDDAKRVIEGGYADMINIKLMKCGGYTKAKEILEYARINGVVCMLGSMLEGPISIEAALVLAFEYRDVVKFVDLDSPLLYKELPQELCFEYQGATIVPL